MLPSTFKFYHIWNYHQYLRNSTCKYIQQLYLNRKKKEAYYLTLQNYLPSDPLQVEWSNSFHTQTYLSQTRFTTANRSYSNLHYTYSSMYIVPRMYRVDQREQVSIILILGELVNRRSTRQTPLFYSEKLGRWRQWNKAVVRSPELDIVARSHRTSVSWGMD